MLHYAPHSTEPNLSTSTKHIVAKSSTEQSYKRAQPRRGSALSEFRYVGGKSGGTADRAVQSVDLQRPCATVVAAFVSPDFRE